MSTETSYTAQTWTRCIRCRCGARGAAKRHRRDRWPGAPFNEIVARYLKAVGDPRDTSAAGSRSTRLCRWARRAWATSVSTNGSAALAQCVVRFNSPRVVR
jgi:hypothetical protein